MVMLTILVAYLIGYNPVAQLQRCTNSTIVTEDAPDIVVTNRVSGRVIVSQINTLLHGVRWATDFSAHKAGVYISYQLDNNSPLYLSLKGNEVLISTPPVNAGVHRITVELWSYRELFQRQTYCFQVRAQ
jgi:hypothetical protein